MLRWFNPCTLTLYIVFAWFLGICYGFVLISSAAGQNGEVNLFKSGEQLNYRLHSTILLNEKGESPKNVGFYVVGNLEVRTLWGTGDQAVLSIQLNSLELHIRSRKAPSPDGFIQHSSKLEEFQSKPFILVWKKGRIDKILLADKEPLALANLKKGIASLFQFQLLDLETNETDSSGDCTVIYRTIDQLNFQKAKTNCRSRDLPYLKNEDVILDTIVQSSRVVDYQLDERETHLKRISGRERHQMYLAAKEDLGNYVEADQVLDFISSGKCTQVQAGNSDEAIFKIQELEGTIYTQETLLTDREQILDEDSSFINAINDVRDNLKNKQLGTLSAAKAFVRLVGVARKAPREEISKALGSKKNQKILAQLYDVLGYVQTKDVHDVVMKKLHFDKEDHLDLSERYLWSLSMSAYPNYEVIQDLLHRHQKNENFPEKVKETLILTLASMASKITKSTPINLHDRKVGRSVEEAILNGLDYAIGENRYVFLRALKNLQSLTTIPTLLTIIKNGTNKEGVLAFKALKSFWPSAWSSQVLQTARRAFFQIDRKYDSSSRTLAVEILLEANPSTELLHDFLHYLRSNDTSFEVKQYVFQRLKMIADEDDDFKARILEIIKSDPNLNNYSTLAPRGLSTALKRNFLKSPSTNGSLLTVQEMFSGIVKRGIVNVMMDKNGKEKELVSLGIFAGGLGGLVSSGDNNNDVEEETATAGMDLTILGTQIRPFVFFNGQGELMGHVWSGTASERTPAFQASIILQDHLEFLRLGNGFVAELNLKGAMSFDLSGKIEISLWNRNAESLVEKSAGIIANGLIVIDTAFVRSQVEFTASVEPKLSLNSNIDFSSNMNLCMRVTQPDTIFRHNIFKIERIPGSKHKLRIAKYKKSVIPGTTYSLNRKNNEMCSAMFA